MYLYKVSFIMRVGCAGMDDMIRTDLQTTLHDKGMSERTIQSVQVTQIDESNQGGVT